ncbi:hypothetical protein K1T71_015309 [Dendrolimus kikuchii]|nr:hypothetical protein K1T71_014938 [Dendrolimus kikuchii]KAJ0169166.1 hypothetical protein K1T71_014921 [Dendrolimus kikuchii]KAJ0169201.1 hypothetical protein K1T71_015309 [Dendrolimus kikuchii]
MSDNESMEDFKREVSGVSVSPRVPEFWTDLPRHWFFQVEAVLTPQKWSDENQDQFVIGQLSKDVIHQVTDILIDPPESENRKIQKLIGEMDLGEQKPSQLLRKMKDLARDGVKDETLAVLWQNHLPVWVRGVLAVSDIKDTTKLALMADKVMENARPAQAVSSVESIQGTSTNIIAEINKLGERTKNLENFQHQTRDRSRQRNRSRPRSRSRPGLSGTRKSNPNWQCFYHYRYKSKARKCIKPCRLRFLVDSGANVSVLPRWSVRNRQSACEDYRLFAANGTPIETYGLHSLTLDLKLRRSFQWTFIVADVKQPIIGADFLTRYKLVIDFNSRTFIDTVINLNTIASISQCKESTIKTIDSKHPYYELLSEYPELTKPVSFKEIPKHNVCHFIETEGPPVRCKSRPLPPDRYNKAKEEFKIMCDMGICRPSKSAWASPLHIVPKKNGQIRLCGDYRQLNSMTKPDRYPLPRLRDFTYVLANKKIFSRLDINRAYNCVSVNKHDI